MSLKTDKKPTNQGLFDTVVKVLKDEHKLPDILDYHIASHNLSEFSNYEFNTMYKLDFGGSEGIYLDCFVEGKCDDTDNTIRVSLGSFKTLQTSEDAMVSMGKLAGHFTYALSKYVNTNLDDFTWTGADVNFYKEDGEYAYGYSCTSMERALQLAEENKARYAKVLVRVNKTRIETIIK